MRENKNCFWYRCQFLHLSCSRYSRFISQQTVLRCFHEWHKCVSVYCLCQFYSIATHSRYHVVLFNVTHIPGKLLHVIVVSPSPVAKQFAQSQLTDLQQCLAQNLVSDENLCVSGFFQGNSNFKTVSV